MTIETEWRNYDVVVVGSGGAGSMAARAAAEEGARVLVVSKDPIGCSDTKISEGNATVRQVATDDDSEATLSENPCMAGGNLPVKEITDAFAKDSKPLSIGSARGACDRPLTMNGTIQKRHRWRLEGTTDDARWACGTTGSPSDMQLECGRAGQWRRLPRRRLVPGCGHGHLMRVARGSLVGLSMTPPAAS